jgi:hypothetical protein
MIEPVARYAKSRCLRENQVCFDAAIGFAVAQFGYELVFP